MQKFNRKFCVDFSKKSLKIKLVLGLTSVIVGLLAANLALFQWVERAGLYYLLGPYARYVCAYGGFFAMIFGAMLVADFINHTRPLKKKMTNFAGPLKTSAGKGKSNENKKIAKWFPNKMRKVFVAITPATLILIMLPTAVSWVSYTATVTITPTTMPRIYYLHRIDLNDVTPLGKLMNSTPPPLDQPEILCELLRGQTCYFYSPLLPQTSISNGTWHLYIWASTASSGKISKLTVQIHVVSSDGSLVKALIGTVSDVTIDYGYSERNITIIGNSVTISENDRIRLTIHVQTGSENDPKGLSFYYDGYGTYQTINHETRLQSP